MSIDTTCYNCGDDLPPDPKDWHSCKGLLCLHHLCVACSEANKHKCYEHHNDPIDLQKTHDRALGLMTPQKAIETIKSSAEILGDHGFLGHEVHLNLIAEWLQTMEIEHSNKAMEALYDAGLALLEEREAKKARPTIVCLCGSTRFSEAFREANLRETLAGHIVLSIGVDTKSDRDLLLAGEITKADKNRLDGLHLRKIDLADEVLVLNVGGYIGDSTAGEIIYARDLGKPIRWLEEIAKHEAPSTRSITSSPQEIFKNDLAIWKAWYESLKANSKTKQGYKGLITDFYREILKEICSCSQQDIDDYIATLPNAEETKKVKYAIILAYWKFALKICVQSQSTNA